MHVIYTLLVIIALLIAYVAAAAADLEINGAEKAGVDGVILSSNSSVNEKLDPIITNRKKDVQLENDSMRSKEAGDRRKMNNSSKSIGELANVGGKNKLDDSNVKRGDERGGLKEDEGEKKGKDISDERGGLKEAEGEKKGKDISDERDDRKEDIKEAEKQEKANNSSSEKLEEKGKVLPDGIQSGEVILPTRKESSHGEECDSSYSCTIEKKALVACLRVPGNESPELSLLVQNKGKDTASISIMAPKFVKLEHNKIELQGKKNKKMKVSIGNGGNDNFIILKAGDGQCFLDFRGLIDSADKTSQFNYAFPPFRIMCLVVIALVATVLLYIKRRLLVSNGHKYQKLDNGLPVSSGEKVETFSTDGWDNNWDDNWDDEEAPKAPSLPATPSLSSKIISTRRYSKEGWKD